MNDDEGVRGCVWYMAVYKLHLITLMGFVLVSKLDTSSSVLICSQPRFVKLETQ